jgi:hypothetical protein
LHSGAISKLNFGGKQLGPSSPTWLTLKSEKYIVTIKQKTIKRAAKIQN